MSAQDLEQRARELLVKWRYAEPANGSMASQNRRDAFRRCANELESVLRQQPAAVDLEQFREAVEQWKMLAQVGETVEAMPVAFRKKPEEYTARIAEADRLLSIIDNAGKVACAEPVAWITPESIRHLAKMSGPANVVVWNCASGDACVPLYAAPRQPAPVVDDAMRELIDAADKAKRAYWLARNSAAGLTNYCEESANSRRCERELDEAERIYRDSGFEAALARAQGVQS